MNRTIRLAALSLVAACCMGQFAPGGEPGDAPEAETPSAPPDSALHLVQEATIDSPPTGFGNYDVYFCNHNLDASHRTTLDGLTPAESIKLFQETPSLAYYFDGSTHNMYVQVRAGLSETDYWHTALPATQANRLAHTVTLGDTVSWYIKPSTLLGAEMADSILAYANPYFDGMLADECFADIPDAYWNAWRSCAPAGDGPLASERAAYEVLWDRHRDGFLAKIKTNFSMGRALIANTAGATYPECDGIMIESEHIILNGEPWAEIAWTAQKVLWQANGARYGDHVLNVAHEYNLRIADLVMKGNAVP